MLLVGTFVWSWQVCQNTFALFQILTTIATRRTHFRINKFGSEFTTVEIGRRNGRTLLSRNLFQRLFCKGVVYLWLFSVAQLGCCTLCVRMFFPAMIFSFKHRVTDPTTSTTENGHLETETTAKKNNTYRLDRIHKLNNSSVNSADSCTLCLRVRLGFKGSSINQLILALRAPCAPQRNNVEHVPLLQENYSW